METAKKPQVKKEWTKPELIVLVRNKPEEAVLTACKFASGGPDSSQFDCILGGCRAYCTSHTPS